MLCVCVEDVVGYVDVCVVDYDVCVVEFVVDLCCECFYFVGGFDVDVFCVGLCVG